MLRQRQCAKKTLPNGLQLLQCRIQLVREFQIHTGPDRVGLEQIGLCLPLVHIGLHTSETHLGLRHRLGRKHFDALRQQHGGFALHHDLVLQILNAFDHFGQTDLQAGQRLARQRRAGFGGIALPSHGICNVQARRLQQALCFLGPITRQCVLAVNTAELVEFFLEQLGRAFVTGRHFAINLTQLIG